MHCMMDIMKDWQIYQFEAGIQKTRVLKRTSNR